jgi:lipase
MTKAQPETRFIDIGDTELEYLYYDGPEPAVVLLHATGFLPWLWHPIAETLAASNRVIAPYFCDHRHKELEDGGLGWMTLAGDIAAMCKGLGLHRPILVGHSMGATVLTLAEGLHGIGASAMVLIEPVFFPEDYYHFKVQAEDHPLVLKSLARRNKWQDETEVLEYLKRKPLFASWQDEFLDLYVRYGTVKRSSAELELTCPPPREAAIFLGGVAYDPWPILPQVKCPVLVLEGEVSGNRQFVDLARAASYFPAGRLQVITGAGHLIPMEKPLEVINILKDVVEKASQAG